MQVGFRLSEPDFRRLAEFVHTNFGIDLHKKMSLVEGRLSGYLQRNGYSGFGPYIDEVLGDQKGDKVSHLLTRVTTNYTYFMREEQHYRFVMNTALPALEPGIADRDLRIWSAGCSSGEEAYTMEMLLDERYGVRVPKWDTQILATDISAQVLNIARQGIYPKQSIENLPQRLHGYFTALDEETVQLCPRIRNGVVFAHFNLMEKRMPFRKKFHIIFCRNVMIYFDNATKEGLISRYYDALVPGGYLIIGLSETINNLSSRFAQVQPSIYQKGK